MAGEHEGCVWAHKPVAELNGVLGYAPCLKSVCAAVIAAGDAEDPRTNTLKKVGDYTGTPSKNTVAPVVSGTPKTGNVLSATTGTYTGTPAPTKTREWVADGVPILNATAATFTLTAAQEGKQVGVREKGANTAGSVYAISNTLLAAP